MSAHRTVPFRSPFLVAGCLAAALTLTACGGDDGAEDGAAATSGGSGSAATSGGSGSATATDDVCAELEAAGATGTTFGPVQAYLPREDLIADIDAHLTPIDGITPPADVAEAWATQRAFLESMRAAAEALPQGGRLTDPALVSPGADVDAAQQALTDWWFDTCR